MLYKFEANKEYTSFSHRLSHSITENDVALKVLFLLLTGHDDLVSPQMSPSNDGLNCTLKKCSKAF